MREFVFGEDRGARKHLVADVALLARRRQHVRRLGGQSVARFPRRTGTVSRHVCRLDVPLHLALRLERQRAVDALVLRRRRRLVACRRPCRRRSRQFVGSGGHGGDSRVIQRGGGAITGVVVGGGADSGAALRLGVVVVEQTAGVVGAVEQFLALDWSQHGRSQRVHALGRRHLHRKRALF